MRDNSELQYNYTGIPVAPNNVVYVKIDYKKHKILYLSDAGTPLNLHEFDIGQIAYQMVHVKRYNGMGMSILKHSLAMSTVLYDMVEIPNNKALAMCALIHDMSEIITGDLVWSSKHRVGQAWRDWQDELDKHFWACFAPNGYNDNDFTSLRKQLKEWDVAFCHYERAVFGNPEPAIPPRLRFYVDNIKDICLRLDNDPIYEFVEMYNKLTKELEK